MQAGVDRALVCDRTLHILSSFLVLGFLCNVLIRPVVSKWLMRPQAAPGTAAPLAAAEGGSFGIGMGGGLSPAIFAVWLAVGRR